MEIGAHVWLRSSSSAWGWIPACISNKEPIVEESSSSSNGAAIVAVRLTLVPEEDELEGGSFYHTGTSGGTATTTVGASNPSTKIKTPGHLPYFETGLHSPHYYGHDHRPDDELTLFPPKHTVPTGSSSSATTTTSIANRRTSRRPFSSSSSSSTITIDVDPEQLKRPDGHADIKLRNMPSEENHQHLSSSSSSSSPTHDDLIHLTHLHEPAILQALRIRYDQDIIYTSTGPILIAINPFKPMPHLYSEATMALYRHHGQHQHSNTLPTATTSSTLSARKPTTGATRSTTNITRLPPHVYQTADDAYRAMLRGLETYVLTSLSPRARMDLPPCHQSILVSGESGAGKTVTTKIVLNYLAVLSKTSSTSHGTTTNTILSSPTTHTNTTMTSPLRKLLQSSSATNHHHNNNSNDEEEITMEHQVLQSNPILEAFGNARTMRNDNSSRFGKYIDIQFTSAGTLSGATITTYLLEKVRLIQQARGERNYHVFYQLLSSATQPERDQFFLADLTPQDFTMLNTSQTYDRRDGVSDAENHLEMLDAMITIGFDADQIQSLMALVVALLFLGNITFEHHSSQSTTTSTSQDECYMVDDYFSQAAATLLGVTTQDLQQSLTTKTVVAGKEASVLVPLTVGQAIGAKEAFIKGIYGAAFDYIVHKINTSIRGNGCSNPSDTTSTTEAYSSYNVSPRKQSASASTTIRSPRGAQAFHFHSPEACIGVLDIFGFESFEINSFEQLCINYTNEALQQQFNKYVFKLEQHEYEREGILWNFISFPDNQDVLDLIDQRHVGILSLLDEQCIVPQSNDQKFTRYLYAKCDKHARFSATATQRSVHKFSIEHYAGPVEYTTDLWLEKNRDQLPAASAELFASSTFDLIHQIRPYIRLEQRKVGGAVSTITASSGSIACKSVGAQFSSQLRALRARIDTTSPHYVRCLKPNDELIPHSFEPKNIVEQLRCGGVLEAVRVSRAGYPTRYHHEVFLRRYFILLGSREESSSGALNNYAKTSGKSNKSLLKCLIEQITLDIWIADLNLIKSLRAAEKYASSPNSKSPERKSIRRPPQSTLNIPAQIKELQGAFDGFVFPETEDDFLSLEFPARCAIAGIQMGKTKVFLRREAFDRIESMRSERVSVAAAIIQARARGVLTRQYFGELMAAILCIQSVARKKIKRVKRFKACLASVITIQRTYRRYLLTKTTKAIPYHDLKDKRRRCAIQIQSAVRRRLSKKYFKSKTFAFNVKKVKAWEKGATKKATELKTSKDIRKHGTSVSQRNATGGVDTSTWKKAPVRPWQPAHQRTVIHPKPITQKLVPPADVPRVIRAPGSLEREAFNDNISLRSCNPETVGHLSDLLKFIQIAEWANVEGMLHKYPNLSKVEDPSTGELPLHIMVRQKEVWSLLIDMLILLYPKALLHRDKMGALPLHHAAAHNAAEALEMIYCAYKDGITQVDSRGRLPLHVAAEFDAVESVKMLLEKHPDGAYTMVHRPPDNSGGGLPLHVACRSFASIGVITALLSENFASGKRTDENGDLPLHLMLRGGESVEQVVVKTLLTCFSGAISRTDMYGDLPLAIALKSRCNTSVLNYLLMQFPNAAAALDGEGRSPLILALLNDAEDRIILSLLNHAPYHALQRDEVTGLIPIQVATDRGHSHNVVYNLLKRDMPIDLKEKTQPLVVAHHYSWNHLVSGTNDEYHHVVSKVLQQCTQPQVLALAHVEGRDGKIALASATPVCRHEMRVMLRLFNSLEVVNQRPAYSNPLSDTQIFYALRFEVPPHHTSSNYTLLYQDDQSDIHADNVEDMDDDVSLTSRKTHRTIRTTAASLALETGVQASVEDKLRQIRNEKGQQVIAKLTSRSDIVERELRVRKDFKLSRHYVPAILSVHHTVQHSAYSEAMAEPGYCIVLEGADTTLENMMVDLRKAGKQFPTKALKRIGIALLHLHEHGLIHGDFGTHNVGKFKDRWKVLGVGGAVPVNDYTDPNRGFYHPPEAIELETNFPLSNRRNSPARVVSIQAKYSYDMWAYGVAAYDAITNTPLAPYNNDGKTEYSGVDLNKVARWDENTLAKALKAVSHDPTAMDLLRQLLHPSPGARFPTMRDVLNHPFFSYLSLPALEKAGIGIQPPPERLSSSSSGTPYYQVARPIAPRDDDHLVQYHHRPAILKQLSNPSSRSFSSFNSSTSTAVPSSPQRSQQKSNNVPALENYENGISTSPQGKKKSSIATLRHSFLQRRKSKNSGGNTKELLLGSSASGKK